MQSALAPVARSINPVDGVEFARYPFQDDDDIDASLEKTHVAFQTWREATLSSRCATLERMAKVLRINIDAYAALITREMGKPASQARAEVEKCAVLCEWYAVNALDICSIQPTQVPENKAYVSYLPIGPVLAVMPWNFPFWQVMRGAVPIIVSGNTYVLKHAPNVMGCAEAIADAWRQASLPEGVFEVINATPAGVSRAIADSRIAAVTVTGSVRAGSAIAAQAGAALKKSVLELGGSDPFIVLADADLGAAVQAAVSGRFQNAGQVCIAAKRIILEAPIAAAFTERFVAMVRTLKMGDPESADTDIGPMARPDLREELHVQVLSSIADGAKVLLGGELPATSGNYYPPTILSEVIPSMTVFRQETFGPVAALIVANDVEHALSLANDSEFGLSAALWTRDVQAAQAYARRIEAGGVFINGYAASDPRVPIGGVKKSGYGRELAHFGILEFMNAQTVWQDRR
jgi:succinate-semialdehyde dehydrogenase